ncbi:hypothetical protein CMI47_03370 [Candidatus Pacearchaeota archaeon]|nr:hypothetical protein [Candidatus Pacearchaeota archaeon]|tara:strand:- start:70 stop:444 length:375 start_codon:yes stop_codon:yes gene_type:complete
MISETNTEKTKKLIKKSKAPIIIKSQSPEYNRKILEYGHFDILLLDITKGRDKIKYLDTGINHVLAKIAAKNKVTIAIDLEDIRKADKKTKAIALARLDELTKTCKKAKCKLQILNTENQNLFI